MSIDTAAIKQLFQSQDVEAIQKGLDSIAQAEASYAEAPPAEQEQILRLQIMLQSRKLAVQQANGASAEDLVETYRNTATLWMRSGETEKAMGQLQKALEKKENDLESLQILARAQLNMSKYEDSIATQEKAIAALEPDAAVNADPLAQAYVQLANIYEAKGDFEQAIEILKKAEKVDDQLADLVQAEIQGKLGVICEKVGRDEEAVTALTKAHALYLQQKGEEYYKTQEMAYLLEMASS